jgi:phosphatidyl-myo-inositol alpha-mannosyltransferase
VRVALISPYDLTVPGGVQTHVRALAAALRRAGDDVRVIGPGPADRTAASRGATARPTHVSVGRSMRVRANGSVAPIALAPGAATRTRCAIAAVDPDVVHVHEPVVPLVGWAAVTARCPVVATFHAWSDSDTLYRLARPLGRRLVDRADDLVAVSAPAAEFHARALGIDPSRFHVVPNGVDVERFRGAATAAERPGSGTIPARRTLLFVGRLERRKGLAVLLAAFQRLAPDRPSLHLEIVGEGPEGHSARGVVPAGLADRVHFLGRLDDDELATRLARSDLYVSPALGGESFGIVLLEAMAAEVPVVASDIPGYRSVAEDGRQARLTPPGDAGALAGAIGALLDDPGTCDRLRAGGRARAAEHDWEVVAARLRARYERASTR